MAAHWAEGGWRLAEIRSVDGGSESPCLRNSSGHDHARQRRTGKEAFLALI